jgi:hypothetical protein
MMIMMFFFSLIVLIMGRMGVRATRMKKATVAHRLFKKSIILLIPFILIVMTLKGQGKRMKTIMEYVMENSNTTLLDYASSDNVTLQSNIEDFEDFGLEDWEYGRHDHGHHHDDDDDFE